MPELEQRRTVTATSRSLAAQRGSRCNDSFPSRWDVIATLRYCAALLIVMVSLAVIATGLAAIVLSFFMLITAVVGVEDMARYISLDSVVMRFTRYYLNELRMNTKGIFLIGSLVVALGGAACLFGLDLLSSARLRLLGRG